MSNFFLYAALIKSLGTDIPDRAEVPVHAYQNPSRGASLWASESENFVRMFYKPFALCSCNEKCPLSKLKSVTISYQNLR